MIYIDLPTKNMVILQFATLKNQRVLQFQFLMVYPWWNLPDLVISHPEAATKS
jgi:hypothetical protein